MVQDCNYKSNCAEYLVQNFVVFSQSFFFCLFVVFQSLTQQIPSRIKAKGRKGTK